MIYTVKGFKENNDHQFRNNNSLTFLLVYNHTHIEKSLKGDNLWIFKKVCLLNHFQSFWLYRSQQTGKFFKRWEYQTTLPVSWEICIQVKKQQLELDMEQQISCKSGKEYVKAVYCHPTYLTSMQSTSWEMLGWKKHKLESRLPGEISIAIDTQMTPHLWPKVK